MDNFWQRIIRAAWLDASVYEEVRKDAAALPQAMSVVLISSAAAGIAFISQLGAGGIIMGAVFGLINWYLWAILAYWIGTRFLPEPQTKANLGQLLRTIGFASAPGLIRVFAVMENLQQLVISLAAAWMLVAMIIAIRCSLSYKSIWRAAGVCCICLVIQAFLLAFYFLAKFS